MAEGEEGIGHRPQSSMRVPGPAGGMQEERGSSLALWFAVKDQTWCGVGL